MPPFTPKEFNRILNRLGLTQIDLARLLSEAGDKPTAPTTINRYSLGKMPIPPALALYMREADRVGDLADRVGELEDKCQSLADLLDEAERREKLHRLQIENLAAELDRAHRLPAAVGDAGGLHERIDGVERLITELHRLLETGHSRPQPTPPEAIE